MTSLTFTFNTLLSCDLGQFSRLNSIIDCALRHISFRVGRTLGTQGTQCLIGSTVTSTSDLVKFTTVIGSLIGSHVANYARSTLALFSILGAFISIIIIPHSPFFTLGTSLSFIHSVTILTWIS